MLTSALLVAIAELLVPTAGLVGLLIRAGLLAAYPLALFASGFFNREERRWLARLRHPFELLAALRALPSAVDGRVPEVYEAERLNEDARL